MNRWLKSQIIEKPGSGDSRCYLLELPTELLLEIISHLSVLPEACLALTCKSLFVICGSILDSKSLHFSRDFAPLFHHYRNGHNFVTSRWQFVGMLEDSRWQACSKCLKLHPRSAFPSRELKRGSDSRACSLGESAGIVDLCPCKKLTYRDKMDLVDLLKIRKKTISALASQFGSTVRERFCWHSCFEKYGNTDLKIELYPELDDEDKLIIRTEYQLTIEAGQLGKEEHMTPRFGCAHRSVDLWLASVCQTTICRLYDSFCQSCQRISICNTCNATLVCPRKQPSHSKDSDRATYFFHTLRGLGGSSSHPDSEWAAQRIHPAEPSVNVDNCSELCPWTVREHPPPTGPPTIGMDIINPGMNDQSLNQLYSSIHMI
ncbi:hypothetical protein MW887_005179 [Aspergillus wentii]|nr:hypothetical protein MW887_005179 [Aspergillus wentii]